MESSDEFKREEEKVWLLIEHRIQVEDDAVPEPLKAVIFFGADGVGKTTHASRLAQTLMEKGYKVKRCWLRARHSLSYLVSQILLSLGYRATVRQGDIEILDSRSLPGKSLWSLLEFVSILPWILTRMNLPLLLGYTVIAERYLVDNIVYNRYYIGEDFKFYEKILLRMIPKNALLIHLDTDRDELLKRRQIDWPKDFIDYQLKQYRNLASELGAMSINTSDKDIEEVSKMIISAYKVYSAPA